MQMKHSTLSLPRAIGCLLGLLLWAPLSPVRAAESPALNPAAMPLLNLDGNTGLLRIPTGEVLPYGQCTVGVTVVDNEHRPYTSRYTGDTVAHIIAVGVLPRLEVSARFTNIHGRLGTQYYDDLGGGQAGWNFDRMFSAQVQVLKQSERLPVSLAVGSQDIGGTSVYEARYAVISHRRPRLGLHLGIGDGRLNGAFGGVDYQITPRVRLMLEHDGSTANIGAAWQWRRFTITPALTGLKAPGGGLIYGMPL